MSLEGPREEFGVALPRRPFSRSWISVLAICTVPVAVQRGAAPVLRAGTGHCKGPGPMGFSGGSGCGTQYSVLHSDTVSSCGRMKVKGCPPRGVRDGFASNSLLYYSVSNAVCAIDSMHRYMQI